jgi:hypothetical protein
MTVASADSVNTLLPAPATGLVAKAAVAPAGTPATLRVTGAANPPVTAIVTVLVADAEAAVTVVVLAEVETVKSPPTTRVKTAL